MCARPAVNRTEKGNITMKKNENAARIENARAARARMEEAPASAFLREEYHAARAALLSVDFAALDGDEMQELCAAAVENAMKRREADSGMSLEKMRARYAEDARQETAARALEMLCGEWIDGDAADGTPRAEMPLALFAAIAAGRALDAIIYADGGHAVKMTAREARENYATAPELRELSEIVKAAESARADAVTDAEKEAAADFLKEARADLNKAAAELAGKMTVAAPAAKMREPVAPAPEAAAIRAEYLPRILNHIKSAKTRAAAAGILCDMYNGYSLEEIARRAGTNDRVICRDLQIVANAAAAVKIEDGESAELERLIESDAATLKNRTTRRAWTAARAALNIDRNNRAAAAVEWTAKKPAAARELATMTYLERVIYCAANQEELKELFTR